MTISSPLKFWNGMIAAAIVAMLALLAFDTFAPKPKFTGLSETRAEAEKLARDQEFAFEQQYEAKQATIDARVWKQSPDAIGALILDRATNLARSKNLTLTAFRPQKPDELGELTRLAYVMTLEGRYPGLWSMVRELESPSHKLSVHLVQVASADEASDLVTATIGISAYVEKVNKETAAKNAQS